MEQETEAPLDDLEAVDDDAEEPTLGDGQSGSNGSHRSG